MFGYGYGLFWDPTYLMLVPALLLALYAQFKVSSTFNRYSAVHSRRGLTGSQVARMILNSNGIGNVGVECVSGKLSDHYDPGAKVIRLSQDVYYSDSIASLGVAAHEAGHAIQHAVGYGPIKIRNAVIPMTNIGSKLSFPLLLGGLLFSIQPLITAGIILFSLTVVFQLVTLPVEFNASSRAIAILDGAHVLDGEEIRGARKVLSAAALTYVAALISALSQLLRLLVLFGGRGRRDD